VAHTLIRLLILDVDGVLTDGALWFDEDGRPLRRFHIRDGLGLALWRAAGGQSALLTSKRSEAVLARARMMRIELIEQGSEDKLPGLARILAASGVAAEQAAYLGDDLLDLAPMRRVGYPMAVGDAAGEVRNAARYVTRQPGGQGAVREAVEHLLKRQDQWRQALRTLGLEEDGADRDRQKGGGPSS